MPEVDENQLMWLEEDGEDDESYQEQKSVQVAPPNATGLNTKRDHGAAFSALEEELQRTRKELMDVRKELAAKTVQLSRKEVIVSQEKVAELAAHVSSEKDKQLASLAAHVEQLEFTLTQKEEELEESRRLYNAQKRALREALAAAAEAEAAERQADEARARTAVAQVVEDELDRLQHELALLQARYDLEMRARDAELQSLRSELQSANANRKQAVAAAEAALTEAWQAELIRATEEASARVAQLEAEVARVRQELEEHARSADTVGLAGELASLNQQKVAIQREFDAFREMATAASREHREAAARLLEENATLKSRLAARAFQDVQAGFKPQSKVFSALSGPQVGPSGAPVGLTGGSSPMYPGNTWMQQLPEVLERLERQRRGLVPTLALCGVVLLFVLAAVIRAAAVTRSEQRGGLCFLAHLGINVGPGCGPKHGHSVAEAAGEELGHLLDQAPRVHDVESVAEAVAATEEAAGASTVAANGKAGSGWGASAAGGLAGGSAAASPNRREEAAEAKSTGKAAAAATGVVTDVLVQEGEAFEVRETIAATGQAKVQPSMGLQVATVASEPQNTHEVAGTTAEVETGGTAGEAAVTVARYRQLRLLQQQWPGKEVRAGLEGRQRATLATLRQSRRVLRSATAMAEQKAR
ncbi:hypothetical protein Vretimale_5796 [Volvox reticuliferus]|uniref:Uncharacterized protein n=1 Tax=Volvox reticuliferus TaxID=1737510 RepID=A0A8J4G6E2_9CHLO|nr:hypothetical protein Vretifemale_5699 [Volvox reticuliferus]GIM00899.1 hypothetical protein Vretimale_5796 [Volvox reticuliferus]